MTTLKLRRTSEYNNALRNYKIFVDDQNIGTIANGEVKEFQITPGQHKIIAKIDWGSSPEILFTIEEDETVELKIGGFKNGNWMIPISLILMFIGFVLSHFYNIYWVRYLVIPAGMMLFYYITIGRKKYLMLENLRP